MEMQLEEMSPQTSRLSELSDKASEQAQSAAFMEPGEKIKSTKRGRPKGSVKEKTAKKIGEAGPQAGASQDTRSEPQGIPTAQVVRPLVNLISVGGAAFAGDDRARMKPEELEAGAMALGMVLDKYMPDLINKYGAEITCLMVFGQYGLRVYAIKKLNDLEKAQAQNKGPDAPTDKVEVPSTIIQ